MSTTVATPTTGGGIPSPVPLQQSNPRCQCDHLLSQHRPGGLGCTVLLLDRESTFRHLCRCGGFQPKEDALEEALAIIEDRTLKMPRIIHLEAMRAEYLKVSAALTRIEKQVSDGLFLQRVARNSFGKFTVMCEGCNSEEGFSSDGVGEGATWLEQNGWELELREKELKLVCPKCAGQ
jgi:hypothetical protein